MSRGYTVRVKNSCFACRFPSYAKDGRALPIKEQRAKRRSRGNTHTKPSSILKSQIPIGHFAHTLNALELSSGWVEPRILINKAHKWAKEAIGVAVPFLSTGNSYISFLPMMILTCSAVLKSRFSERLFTFPVFSLQPFRRIIACLIS